MDIQAIVHGRILISPCGFWKERRCWENMSDLPADFILKDGTKFRVILPKGFIFDGASVPHVPGIWELFGDLALVPAGFHDLLYRKNSLPVVTKAFADWAFWALMVSENDPPEHWKRDAMWKAVHEFGRYSYHVLNVEDDVRSL